MTSDLMQNIIIANKMHAREARVELTREKGFLDGSRDIFDLLDHRHEPQNQPLPKNITDLLRAAYDAIETAESTIANQNNRIKTLEDLLTIDELTGLTNRRGFMSALAGETDRMNRGQSQGGLLIMIDLNLFKQINDTHGHAAGDEALRVVGTFLKTQIRDMDVAARLGGDEFVLLFPNSNKKKIFKRAKTLRDDLNALSFVFEGKTIPIRAGLGLKDYLPGCNIDHIIHQADMALYADKKAEKANRQNA